MTARSNDAYKKSPYSPIRATARFVSVSAEIKLRDEIGGAFVRFTRFRAELVPGPPILGFVDAGELASLYWRGVGSVPAHAALDDERAAMTRWSRAYRWVEG